MISSTYNSTAIYVVDDLVDWGAGVRASFEAVADTRSSLSDREGRRGYSSTLRVSIRFGIIATKSKAMVLDSAMRSYQAEPLVVPFLPGVVEWASRASRTIAGGLYIVWKRDWSQWEIYEGTEPSWPTGAELVAPALWGRIDSKSLDWIDATKCRCDIDFIEDSKAGWALSPVAATLATGPTPASGYGSAPYVAPTRPDFSDGLGDQFLTRIVRASNGFTRQSDSTLYPQTNAQEFESSHVVTGASIGKLLYFFQLHAAGKPFWIPRWTASAIISSAVGATDTTLNVTSGHTVQANDYVALCSPGSDPITRKATAVASTTVTLDSAPGALDQEDWFVSRLLIARFSEPVLTVSWIDPLTARASIKFRELPPEYSQPSGETIGTTLGALPTRAYLYEFRRVLAGVTFYERFTSFESDLTYSANTYTSANIKHGEITQGLALDRDELDVSCRVLSVTALKQMVALRSPSPVFLTITQVDVSGSTGINAVVVFSGEVTKPKVTGDRVAFSVVPGGSLWEQNVPGFRLQPGCNHSLFSTGCKLLTSDWKFTATITSVGTAGYPFEFVLGSVARVTGATPTYFNHWFALGWIEFGSGATWQRRQIVDSTTVTAGACTVTLNRDPDPFPTNGDAVVLYPGCDLRMESCKAYNGSTNPQGKFDNFANFGGFPFIPVANPSLVKLSKAVAGGKK